MDKLSIPNFCSTYVPVGTKTIHCIDCGCDVEVDAMNTKTIRCKEHQHEFDNAIKTLDRYKKNGEEQRLIYHINGLFLAEPKATEYILQGYEYSNIKKMEVPTKKYDYLIEMVDLKNDVGHIEFLKCKRIYDKTVFSLIMDLKQDDYTYKNGIKTIKIKSRMN